MQLSFVCINLYIFTGFMFVVNIVELQRVEKNYILIKSNFVSIPSANEQKKI